MSLLSYIGLIGGACSLAGYAPYAKAVIRGETAPERASWLIWTLSNCLVVLSYWQIGGRTTVWVPLAYVIGSALITVLAFIYGKEGWGVLEKLALIVAIISSIRWVFFDQPLIALGLTMAIGLISYIPSAIKLARDKERHKGAELEGWTLFFMGSIFNLIAVDQWTPIIATLPVAFFILNGTMFALHFRNSLIEDRAQPPIS
ncbi:hypothetical protein KW799_01205 [Candidatus Parcubacteria bacterium]|nr:hypothetical protein [Candidatus Parcubacteria bacterium]